jgi:hypothetical protein
MSGSDPDPIFTPTNDYVVARPNLVPTALASSPSRRVQVNPVGALGRKRIGVSTIHAASANHKLQHLCLIVKWWADPEPPRDHTV